VRKSIPLSIAFVAVALVAAAAPARADMRFRVVALSAGGPRVIAADGQITRSTMDDFRAFLLSRRGMQGLRTVVYLHSPGGSVAGAMKLGEAFRRIGAGVVVARMIGGDDSHPGQTTAGGCFSACVYALMGGARRAVPAGSLVGVHKMYAFTAGADPSGDSGARRRDFDDGAVAGALARYARRMGVSRELVERAERSSPDAVHMLSRSEIRRWRLGGAGL
jgi:hypothetical protein